MTIEILDDLGNVLSHSSASGDSHFVHKGDTIHFKGAVLLVTGRRWQSDGLVIVTRYFTQPTEPHEQATP